jgi:hypothetical protein
MQLLAYSCLILGAILGASAQQSDPVAEAALVAKLLTAPTQVGRLALLNDTDASRHLDSIGDHLLTGYVF